MNSLEEAPGCKSLQTYYAPEVEERLVSLVWHHPEHLARVLQQLDPEVHFVQPHIRHILEAVRISYSELGECDWTTVVQVLREQKMLEEVGNLELLDQVWRHEGCMSFLDYYIELLQDYAIQRGIDPHQPVFRFTGGRIQIKPNRSKSREGQPDYVGAGRVCGNNYQVRGWTEPDGLILNLKLYPKT